METTMSESRTQLEEILELLLAEENEKAEEMLHEYVVAKARAEYEKVLDEDSSEDAKEVEEEAVEESEESEEEAVEETVDTEEEAVEETIEDSDPAGSFVDEILRDEEEIEGDMNGEEEEMEMDADSEENVDLEDEVEEIKDELEDLKAEFEKLLADEEGDEMEDGEEAEMEVGDELDLESVEYDLDETTEEDEVVEEATKLSDTVKTPSAPVDDNKDAPLPSGGSKVGKSGTPVKLTDGGEGNHGESAKDHTPSDNIKVEPKKA
tara:strand:- start:572 stop:1366 length:795 start_codon:yes stop_codon:yes gene_type:complete